MGRVLLSLLLALGVNGAAWADTGGAAHTGTGTLPDLEDCLARNLDRYEWLMEVHADQPLEAIEGGIWFVEDVKHCGTLGIVRCDLSAAPVPCQHGLAARLDALAAEVRATLPAPEAVRNDPGEGGPDGWAMRLYESSHALAGGRSAGSDCAGASRVMAAWCAAHEAGNRLRDAIMAWQVARYMGEVPDAVTAGWARRPPPVHPRPRPMD